MTAAASRLAQFGTKHVAKGIGRMTTEVIESGAGSYVTMVGGKRYLDFTVGIGVANLGHCHPGVTKAIQSQVGTLVHGQGKSIFIKNHTDDSSQYCISETISGVDRTTHSTHATSKP